jgi:hypothetical protein
MYKYEVIVLQQVATFSIQRLIFSIYYRTKFHHFYTNGSWDFRG